MRKSINELEDLSKKIRLHCIDMAYHSMEKGAHLGGALSCVEIMAVLYAGVACLNADNPTDELRDRIIIGKGHCTLALYSTLYEMGYITKEMLDSFEEDGSNMVGHPIKNPSIGIEYSSGSLGMALSYGAGIAYVAKQKKDGRTVFVLLGDGECQEGSVWEASMFASKYFLGNLCVIVDQNKMQSDGYTENVIGFSDLSDKFKSCGFKVISVDGHNIGQLLQAFSEEKTGCPIAIIANTVKGKGVSFMENDYKWHHSTLSKEQYEIALKEIMEG